MPINYFKRACELVPELIADRRYLHQHPELGHNLTETTTYVKQRLIEMGYTPKSCGKGGIIATVGGKRGGKVFLLRADMDALPMREESGLEFASHREAAHTCGHDTHTAMLLCAAKMLKEQENNLCGTVKLMFQPAEEILTGARSMIDDGVLEAPTVDAALGLHIIGGLAPVGALLYGTGPVASSSDIFEITITGRGGHGAMPQNSVDPLIAAAHLLVALQELNAREVTPGKSAVLTFGCFHAGDAENIIPDKAILRGTLRTYSSEVREQMRRRLVEMTQLNAQMFRAHGEVSFKASVPALISNEILTLEIREALCKIFSEKQVQLLPEKLSGSEDFAEISQLVPTTFLALGAGTLSDGCCYGQHHPKVIFKEEAFPVGAAAYAQAATEWLALHC